jgi:hypothetical protein
MYEKGLMLMVSIEVQKKIKKEFYNHQNLVDRIFFCNNYFYIIFIVNDLIEEEIHNGIPSERIVSEEIFINFDIYSHFR